VCYKFSTVSEEYAASMFRVEEYSDSAKYSDVGRWKDGTGALREPVGEGAIVYPIWGSLRAVLEGQGERKTRRNTNMG
jgi:hypothetical protein